MFVAAPFLGHKLVALLTAKMRHIDLRYGIGGDHGEKLSRLHRPKPLARLEHRQRA